MQTALAEFIRDTAAGREADSILRKCVHCGFCTATCPTYQLLGDELDGPRGRIYLIKQVLEGAQPSERTRLHLDRCLTCRSCETTCPSGVRYARLLEIGRAVVEEQAPRPLAEQARRAALRAVLPHRGRFAALLATGRALRPLLPRSSAARIPERREPGPWPAARHERRALLVEGCVQPSIAPRIDAAAARVLDRLGVSLVRVGRAGCCGAVSYHLGAHAEGLEQMRRNIDAWWPEIERGVEAIVVTASACAAMVKEYGELLAEDPRYGERAARVSALARDLSELVAGGDLSVLAAGGPRPRVAFHSPCTLQHAQRITGTVERMLAAAGYPLVPVADGHLCCGSAGTYSILQPEISERLLANKIAALTGGAPERIATANIGCLVHLAGAAPVPVVHWIELLDPLGE